MLFSYSHNTQLYILLTLNSVKTIMLELILPGSKLFYLSQIQSSLLNHSYW